MTKEEKETLISAAQAVRTESEMLSDLLSRGEVLSDHRLVAHYETRRRALDVALSLLERCERDPSEANAEALRRELILLRLQEKGEESSYAGAGVCVYAPHNNMIIGAEETLRAIVERVGLTLSVRERAENAIRAEAMGERSYAILSALTKGALGENVPFAVYPVLSAPEVREEDVRVDIFLNGGKGGQNVNKVETAVRMTHLPTGVTVTCRDERSQLQNKKRAAKSLRAAVYNYYAEAQEALVADAKRRL